MRKTVVACIAGTALIGALLATAWAQPAAPPTGAQFRSPPVAGPPATTPAISARPSGTTAPPARSAGTTTPPGAPYAFGTLVTDAVHARQEAARGVTVAMMELQWSSYEPAEGRLDRAYARNMRAWLATLRGAGMRVTLGLGLHFTPGWIFGYPDSRFVDQKGRASGEANLVFNQALRIRAERYLAQVDRDLGMENFWAVRLTSGGHPEVLYPAGGTYWAFDRNAQGGPGRPPTMAPNPLPGWRPGDRSAPVDRVRRWADWYVHGLVDVVSWQIRRLAALGFAGYHQTVTPGAGTRPDGYAHDVAGHLPDGVTGVGAVWHRFYAGLRDQPNVVAYVSSMANEPGNDDGCAPGDAAVALTDDAVSSWPAARWIARVAREHGLPVSGENPGWGMPAALNAHYADRSGAGMMAAAVRQMTSCRFQGMYWAHDEQLWTVPGLFDTYAARIAAVNGPGRSVPPMP